jgi:hypothetical protein
MTAEQQRVFGRLWQTGTGDVELIDGGGSGDVAWLVMVTLVDAHTIDEVRDLLG